MPQPTSPANSIRRVLGADVAKNHIVFHDSLSGQHWSAQNEPEALLQALRPYAGYLWLVCETTGGYERQLLDAAHQLALPACRADAAQVKAFIASHGARAKTDRIDAAWLARYGLERGESLRPWQPPDPNSQAFTDLAHHRQHLIDQRTQASNRRSAPAAHNLHDLLDEQIAFLSGQIDRVDRQMDALVKASSQLRHDEEVLREIPGIGPVASRAILAFMPEIGQCGPKQIASLAGLAPHPRDSGQSSKHRFTSGGRTDLRAILFLAALSAARAHPTLKVFYKRLLDNGKPKRLALIAVARKLIVIANALIRDSRKPQSAITENASPN